MSITLRKYHGLGNDYLVYDCNINKPNLCRDQIRLLCNRNFGIGSDGILVGPIWKGNKVQVKIYNPDGSEAEKSGNGIRIFAKYLKDSYYIKKEEFNLSTLGGDVKVNYLNTEGTMIKVSMGRLSFMSKDVGMKGKNRELVDVPLTFHGEEYQCTCVSIGNPHCVILMKDISKETACMIGKHSEVSDYFEHNINTQIVKILDRNNIQIEIYERGAGYTLASGSSSCAAAGAMHRLGLIDKDIKVHMPGGCLTIYIEDNDEVSLTGSVSYIGQFQLSDEFLAENNFSGRDMNASNSTSTIG